MPLYGRNAALRVISRCAQTRGASLLVFTGTRFSGKTALLDQIVRELEQQTPCAYLDLEKRYFRSFTAVLDALVPQLRQGAKAYGRRRFSRYLVARLVMTREYPIADINDREATTAAIAGLLERPMRTDELRNYFGPIAGPVAAQYQVPPELAKVLVELAFDAFTTWMPGRSRVLRKRGVHWFQQQDRLSRRPEEVLTDFYIASRDTTEGGVAATNGLLMSAFLADLRADLKEEAWMGNAAVLVDNADGPVWWTFTDVFLEHQDPADPLMVIATSRGLRAPKDHASIGTELAQLTTVAKAERAEPARLPMMCTIGLPGLTHDEVTEMVEKEKLPGANDGIAAIGLAARLYELTGGHAGATWYLLNAVRDPREPVDLRGLLDTKAPPADRPAPETPGIAAPAAGDDPLAAPTVGDDLLDSLVRAVRDGQDGVDREEATKIVDDLATCSAARDLLWMEKLFAEGRLPGGRRVTTLAREADIHRRELWVAEARQPRPVLLPVLRRLLLRRLAARPADSPYGWASIHRILRDMAADSQEQDDVGVLYHSLALGDLGIVAEHMLRHFGAGEVATWLKLMRATLVAPNRLDLSGSLRLLAADLASAAGGEDDRTTAMANLVAAQWLMCDPLTSGRRSLLESEAQDAYAGLRNGVPVRLKEVLPETWREAWTNGLIADRATG